MGAAYSEDLRRKVVDAYAQQEGSLRVLARRFKVSLGFVRDLVKRYRATGELKPKAYRRGVKPKVEAAGEHYLRELIRQAPALTLWELSERYERRWGVRVSKSAMDRTLRRLKLTRKKTHYDPQRDSDRVLHLRAAYREEIAPLPAEQLIFLDEMGATLNLTLDYGRAVRGQRVYGQRPTARGQRISTIGALSEHGLQTALCFEGTLTGAVFLYFLVHFLCPLLKPGHVVVVDKAGAQQGDGVVELMEATGARVRYLPPYSPDLNPIELAWSKVKHLLRKAPARTRDALYEALAQALNTLTPANAQGYFKHVSICV